MGREDDEPGPVFFQLPEFFQGIPGHADVDESSIKIVDQLGDPSYTEHRGGIPVSADRNERIDEFHHPFHEDVRGRERDLCLVFKCPHARTDPAVNDDCAQAAGQKDACKWQHLLYQSRKL